MLTMIPGARCDACRFAVLAVQLLDRPAYTGTCRHRSDNVSLLTILLYDVPYLRCELIERKRLCDHLDTWVDDVVVHDRVAREPCRVQHLYRRLASQRLGGELFAVH